MIQEAVADEISGTMEEQVEEIGWWLDLIAVAINEHLEDRLPGAESRSALPIEESDPHDDEHGSTAPQTGA